MNKSILIKKVNQIVKKYRTYSKLEIIENDDYIAFKNSYADVTFLEITISKQREKIIFVTCSTTYTYLQEMLTTINGVLKYE